MQDEEPEVQQQIKAGVASSWPVGVEDWERRAAATLDRGAFDWIAGGSGEEWTLAANREAFRRRQLRPRVLAGTSGRDLSVEILGAGSPSPFLLAPIGSQTVAHPEGERATARAALAARIPMLVSTAASTSMEDIAEVYGEGPLWYQLYWVGDRDVTASLLGRAEAAGYQAIVLTVDVPIVGWHDRGIRNDYVPFLLDHGIKQYTSDPVFGSRLEVPHEQDPSAAGRAVMKMFPNPSLSWSDMAWLRRQTALPLVMKGIMTPEDALRAREAGFEAVVVSNHGGRQLDGAMASLDALPAVREALGADATVLMDGGVRRGSDVVKALALGADAVLLGRPYIYGLVVGGQAGVEHVLSTMQAEIDLAFTLAGARRPEELDPSFVTP